MTKEERYQESARQLLKLVGGKENIISAAHCATRLRLVLKDESKADVDEIPDMEKNVIYSPLAGEAIPMSEVPDDTFAAEVLGKGMAVIPSEGKVVAPCGGEVSTLFDTRHAVGITTKDGTELLIHVGVNTVELEGKYYTAHVAQGDKVKPGQLLLTFDMQKIEAAGYPVVTPVIVANTDEYKNVVGLKTGKIRRMEPLIKVEEACGI